MAGCTRPSGPRPCPQGQASATNKQADRLTVAISYRYEYAVAEMEKESTVLRDTRETACSGPNTSTRLGQYSAMVRESGFTIYAARETRRAHCLDVEVSETLRLVWRLYEVRQWHLASIRLLQGRVFPLANRKSTQPHRRQCWSCLGFFSVEEVLVFWLLTGERPLVNGE